MPSNLSKNLTPLGVSSATITKIYGSIKTAKTQSAEIRAAVITGMYTFPLYFLVPCSYTDVQSAWQHTTKLSSRFILPLSFSVRHPLPLVSTSPPHCRSRLLTLGILFPLATAFVPLIAALLTTNYYLGKTQNAVDGKLHAMYREGESEEHEVVQEKK